jgi:vesicular inhibitory amino acid transporter
MAVVGWLMFGDTVRDEITANILLTAGYPRALSICITIFIAIIPITKVPLKYVSPA